MTESEKREQLTGLNRSIAEADRFSRPLTTSERQRMRDLTISYEEGKKYPTGKITYIDSQKEIFKDEFYFLAENSTFYLPNNELTDEQLLEMIDLSHNRADSHHSRIRTDSYRCPIMVNIYCFHL